MSVDVSETQTRPTLATARADARAGAGWSVLQDARLLLIAVWLGASVFFSFVVAPSAFAVLPARELAGNLVTRTLGIVNVAGFIISLLLIASARAGRATIKRRALWYEVIALTIVAMATF